MNRNILLTTALATALGVAALGTAWAQGQGGNGGAGSGAQAGQTQSTQTRTASDNRSKLGDESRVMDRDRIHTDDSYGDRDRDRIRDPESDRDQYRDQYRDGYDDGDRAEYRTQYRDGDRYEYGERYETRATVQDRSQWKKVDEVAAGLRAEGYEVRKLEMKTYGYEAKVRDRDGRRLELRVDPVTGKGVVSEYE